MVPKSGCEVIEHRREIAVQFFASGCQPAYVLHSAKEPLNKGLLGVDVRIIICGMWMQAFDLVGITADAPSSETA